MLNYSEGSTVKYIFESVIITSFWEFALRVYSSAFTCVMKKRFFIFSRKVTCRVLIHLFKWNTRKNHTHIYTRARARALAPRKHANTNNQLKIKNYFPLLSWFMTDLKLYDQIYDYHRNVINYSRTNENARSLLIKDFWTD